MPTSAPNHEQAMLGVLAQMAPGTPLRDGLQRILRGRTGGLVVLGQSKTVAAISSGGFNVDTEFTATRLRELAKMDGAVICDREASRILSAGVQLLPDPSIETDEQGTRHRTADRVARQTGLPVISVSKSMNTIALYFDGRRHVLEESAAILSRANQAIATLERYTSRLTELQRSLTNLEIEEIATVRDVAAALQRSEMVRRIATEIRGYIVELGTDGRLLSLHFDELIGNADVDRFLLIRDYLPGSRTRTKSIEAALQRLAALSQTELIDLVAVANALDLAVGADELDNSVRPRGYRMVASLPRVQEGIAEALVAHFGTLSKLLSASVDDLRGVEGIGEARAKTIREGLSRIVESSLNERY